MLAAMPTITETAKPPRPKRWIPLSLRMFVTMIALLFVANSLWVGVPAYRQDVAIREINRFQGEAITIPGRLHGLAPYLSWRQMRALDEIDCVYFLSDQKTLDSRLKHPRTGFEIHHAILEPPSGWVQPPTINNEALSCIERLPDLRQLDLSYTNVGDAGLLHVCILQHLVWLNIDGTDVSDASVDRLKGLNNLRDLFVRDTQLTEAGIGDLQAALPQLTIHK